MEPTAVNVLTLFVALEELLFEPSLKEELSTVFLHEDDSEFAAYLLAALPEELSFEEKVASLRAFYALSLSVSSTMLEATAELLGLEINEKFFKRVSRVFLEVDEAWEEVITKEYFLAFSEFHDGTAVKALPPQQLIIINHVLAHCAERLPAAQAESMDLMAVARNAVEQLFPEDLSAY